MRRLERFPSAASNRYPWDEIMDGNPWELRHGEDFHSKPATLIANARSQAKRRGGTIRTRTFADADGTRIVLQYLGGSR